MKKLLTSLLLIGCSLAMTAQQDVSLTMDGMTTTMKNGLVELTINSNGQISTLKSNGMNVLGTNNVYFDYTASASGLKGETLKPSKAEVIRQTADYAEVLYSNTTADVQFQQGFIVRKGVKGVYMYVIANGTAKSAGVKVQEARVCTRLAPTYLNGYVDDQMRGLIPSNTEMAEAEKETNTIQDATYYLADGSVYTKYNWAQYVVRDSVHGLMNTNGLIGVWNIHCSPEWYPGGPMKQELTVHATSKSPITIQMLQGEHFGTNPVSFANGERKIYGPFLLYLNFNAAKDPELLIEDAKQMAHQQQQEWPFEWFENELYPLDRATVSGQIDVKTGQRRDSIQVVLAQPGIDQLYDQNKEYMFWALTDKDGRFNINNVRKGKYTLHAYATAGDVTDELQKTDINVDDSRIDLGTIEWTPFCYEHKLFIIGQNNRMSDGFNLSDHPRAYGLWDKVPSTLTYTVGTSTPEKDWYFGQVRNGNWYVKFNNSETFTGKAHLTISAAGVSNSPKLNIMVNGKSLGTWTPSPNDASVYRSAVLGGRHHRYTAEFPASYLKTGVNTVTLAMSGIGKNGGILYDCLKLEAGERVLTAVNAPKKESEDKGTVLLFTTDGRLAGTFASLSEARVSARKGLYVYKQGQHSGKFVK